MPGPGQGCQLQGQIVTAPQAQHRFVMRDDSLARPCALRILKHILRDKRRLFEPTSLKPMPSKLTTA